MQSCSWYIRSTQSCRLSCDLIMKYSGKGKLAGSANIHQDIVHDHNTLFRWIFIGDMSTWIFASRREIIPISDLVDFNDCSVNIVIQITAHITDLIYRSDDLLCRIAFSVKNNRYPMLLQDIHSLAMTFRQLLRPLLHIKYKHTKPTLLCNSRIQLPQCSCRQISWIGSQLLSRLFLLKIIAFKIFMGHVYFPAKLQGIIRQLYWPFHIRDHKRIGCHILTNQSISSGFCKNKP